MLAILIFFICSVKSSGRGVVCSISLALTFSHLRQGSIEVADVALWAHPALRTIDTLQIIADELEELVRLAGREVSPSRHGGYATFGSGSRIFSKRISSCQPSPK